MYIYKPSKVFIFVLIMFLPLKGNAGGIIDDGIKAFKSGDYAKAREVFESDINSGNPIANFYLGIIYREGYEVTQDKQKAFALLMTAAKADHASSQFSVAYMLERGIGTNKDFASAFYWYEKAAMAGHSASQVELANYLSTGITGKKDYIESYKWYLIVLKTSKENANPHEETTADIARHNSELVMRRLNDAEIQRANELANSWIKTHSK